MAICLMYHNFVENESDKKRFPPEHRPYILTHAQFLGHLEIASDFRVHFLTPDDLVSARPLSPQGVLLTFDDSWREHRWTALTLFRQGITGLFFLNSGHIGQPGMLTAENVPEMSSSRQEIGSHGILHDFFTVMGDDGLASSLAKSKADLEALSGQEVRFLSAPGGRFDDRVAGFAREAGYSRLFTSKPGRLSAASEQFALNRIAITADTTGTGFRRILARAGFPIAWRLARYRMLQLLRVFKERREGVDVESP